MNAAGLRVGLIDGIRAARAAERDVFATLDAGVRDAPAADGGWSPKDVQAHLTAWKGRTVERLRALRVGLSEPIEVETDEANAKFHAERSGWTWELVLADADATTDELVTEIQSASDETLGLPRISGTIMARKGV